MAEAESIETDVAAPRRTGRAVAWLALLIALAAAGAVGYGYWTLIRVPGEAAAPQATDAAQREAALGATIASLRAEAQQGAAQRSALAADVATLGEALAAARTAMATSSQPATPPSPRQWRLAEAEYLLRIANQRLLMERDAPGAAALLLAADDVLAALDDFALHGARAAIAEERAALLAVRTVDVQGVYLKIEAAKGLLGDLPLRLPEYMSPPVAEEELGADASMVEHLLARLSGMVRLRNHNAAIRPLLPPDQAEYLEQRLRLALDRAQLAVLRGDQTIYAASLGAASEHLREFVNLDREPAATVAAEIEALLDVDLDAALPDISRSLALLRTEPAAE